MAKKSKTKNYENIIVFDLHIHQKANDNDRERYDAVLPAISYSLFKDDIGSYGGRETCLGQPEDGYYRSNYWYVLESSAPKAQKEFERIIKNFQLNDITKLDISAPIEANVDYKASFKKEKTLDWCWTK